MQENENIVFACNEAGMLWQKMEIYKAQKKVTYMYVGTEIDGVFKCTERG